MFIAFINRKYGCRSKNGQDNLSYEEVDPQPATSLQCCNVPNPPIGEEDATMALTIRAKSPMNMCIHKIAETECLNKCFD